MRKIQMQKDALYQIFCIMAAAFFLIPGPITPAQSDKVDTARQRSNRPVVAILPITSDDRTDIPGGINKTIYDTLSLTLKFMGMYRVEERQEVPTEDISQLKRMCEEEDIDNILFGSTRRSKEGDIHIQLKLYDRLDNRINHEVEGTSESLLGILETSDALVVDIVEGFSGVHVEYGTAKIIYRGLQPDMKISIDQNSISKDLTTIDKMVAGEHHIEVSTMDEGVPEEQELTLFSKVFNVGAGSIVPVVVSIPMVEEEKSRRLTKFDRDLAHQLALRTPKVRTIESRIDWALGFVRESSYPGARLLSEKYEEWKRYIRDNYLWQGRASTISREMTFELFGNSQHIDASIDEAISEIRDEFTRFFYQKELTDDVQEYTSIETTFKLTKRYLAPYRHIEVDGRTDDWDGIEALVVDGEDDTAPAITGNDVGEVYMAMDESYTYVLYRLLDGRPSGRDDHWFNVDFDAPNSDTQIILQVADADGVLHAHVQLWNHVKNYEISNYARGCSVAVNEDVIEARFLNSHMKRLLIPNGPDETNLDMLFFRGITSGTEENGEIRNDRVRVSSPGYYIY